MMRGAAPVRPARRVSSSGSSARSHRTRLLVRFSTRTAIPARRLASCPHVRRRRWRAMSNYLDLVGCRLLDGFGHFRTLRLELPRRAGTRDPIVRGRRRKRHRGCRRAHPDIRLQVTDEHRAQFDELLGEAVSCTLARRTGRLQRHLGVRHHASRRARGRRRLEDKGRVHRRRTFRRRPASRDVFAGDGAAGPSPDELAQRFADRSSRTAKEGARCRSGRRLLRCPTRRASRGCREGHASDRHRVRSAVRPVLRLRTTRTCCAVCRQRRRIRRSGRRVSALRFVASCRPTCSSPSRRPRRSTSCCRCSARSSRQRRSVVASAIVRASTASLGWSDARRDRPDPPTVRAFGSTRDGRSDGIRVDGVVPLADAHEESRFGAKATVWGRRQRTGLPLPPGVALSGFVRRRRWPRQQSAIEQLAIAARSLVRPLAVRSSAVDEDGADAEFARPAPHAASTCRRSTT